MTGQSRGIRVKKSGNLARYIAISVGFVFVSATLIGMTQKMPGNPFEWTICALFISVPTWGAIRSLMVGVWKTDDGIVARSWLRTYRFARAAVSDCGFEPYWGFFSRGGPDWFLKNLVIVANGHPQPLLATVALRRIVNQEIAEISEHLGLRVAAPRREASHRRTR